MRMTGRARTLWLAIATGVAVELIVGWASGRREAWDSAVYWQVGFPATALVALGIGFVAGRFWYLTAAIVPAQVFTMIARSGDLDFSLWPLTVVFSSILGLPFIAAAFIGSLVRRAVTKPPA